MTMMIQPGFDPDADAQESLKAKWHPDPANPDGPWVADAIGLLAYADLNQEDITLIRVKWYNFVNDLSEAFAARATQATSLHPTFGPAEPKN